MLGVIWASASGGRDRLSDQQAAGCSYRQSAISRLPGSFSTHMGSTPPVCRGIYENDSRTRTEGSIEGAGASPGPWPGVTKSPRDRDWLADGRDCNRHQRVCCGGLQPEERILARPSSRPAGTLSADLE